MSTKTIKLKRSSTPNKKPDSLEDGELALNMPDGRLYSNRSNDNGWFSNDRHIIESHRYHIKEDHTIEDGYNGLSIGPIEIDDNVIVTIPTGSIWYIMA